MSGHTVRRYGGFIIRGKAADISSKLQAMIGREVGRIPSTQIDGGRHEVDPENHIPTNQAAVSPSERRRVVVACKGEAIARLRGVIAKMEGRV